jgi:hypothetical protein
MSASADELSEEVSRLQRGDELEVIGSREGFLNVRTPAGDMGWIRRGTVSGKPPAGTLKKSAE